MPTRKITPAATARRLAASGACVVAVLAAGCSSVPGVAGTVEPSATAARAAAVVTPGTITSAGPLTRVRTSPTLDCAVDHIADAVPEFYLGNACMTAVYASLPGFAAALSTPRDVPSWSDVFTPTGVFLPTSQVGPTGTGTADDPFKVVTVASSFLEAVTQTDTYVVGQSSYRTDIDVTYIGGTGTADLTVYRAADCNMVESDYGFGSYDPATGSVGCRDVADPTNPVPTPGARQISWTPITPGSHHFEGSAYELWSAVDARQPFPDSCRCGTSEDDYVDNGAGLSWTFQLGPMQSTRVSLLTTFSPTGTLPLVTTKTADSPTTSAGGTNGYTIGLHNPNAEATTVRSVSDDLPDGFSYRAGTTAGATTVDPDVGDGRLTWAGPFSVPAGGELTLHFGVDVSRSPGPFTNDASADAGAIAVAPAVDAAPVEVTGVPNEPPIVDAGDAITVPEGSQFATHATVTDPDGPTLTHEWDITPDPTAVAGRTCPLSAGTGVDVVGSCNDNGDFVLRLTADDSAHPPVSDTTGLTVTNVPPSPGAVSVAPETVAVGAPVTVTGRATDPGTNDTLGCAVRWDDGGAPVPATFAPDPGVTNTGTCTASHTYATAGSRPIEITFTDDDGGVGSATASVNVGAPPTPVDAGDDVSGVEGSPIGLHGSVSAGSSLTWTFTAGAGVDPGAVCTAAAPQSPITTVTCTDDGSWLAVAHAPDGSTDSATVTVSNAAPVLGALTSPPTAAPGEVVHASVSASDPGSNDRLTCSIDWGEGTPVTSAPVAGVCAGDHTYSATGSRTVGITLTDDDLGSATASAPIDVRTTVTPTFGIGFSGDPWYRNSGPLTGAGFRVERDWAGVASITGTGSIAGRRASSLVVTFDVHRLWIFPLWVGTVTWHDGDFAGTALVVSSDITTVGTTTRGTAGALTFDGAIKFFQLDWTIP